MHAQHARTSASFYFAGSVRSMCNDAQSRLVASLTEVNIYGSHYCVVD